ncbi:uncharacterized protein LOC119832508 [Zerene cesonia]|uniref:uncharacterized protein LOC119832508 n=1 Tax=Zerene cesonia TaxID=33412 RepID=UPI0018E57AFD|nr:uncharacterized protein LOC119832508 [Zerene cesonia]
MISTNYIVFVTIALMVILTVLLPNFSYRLNKTTELQEIKKVLDEMEGQIEQAEAACFTAAEELCILQYTMRDEETNTIFFPQRNQSYENELTRIKGYLLFCYKLC